MEYKVIKSKRKTFSMEVRPEGVIVRAPMRASQASIQDFVLQHQAWAQKHLARLKVQKQNAAEKQLSEEEITQLAEKAKQYLPGRAAHYADLLGVSYGRITIRCQKTKWGSCSSQGNLNFNCLLMLTPPQVIDAIVVHELCHRLEMNHSRRFYEYVYRVFPGYDQCHQWLKDHGRELLLRAHE